MPALLTLARGCDVSYDFGANASAKATSLSVSLTWWQVLAQPSKPNVFLATATGTACNSGYFGAQVHGDGSHSLLFSMWDAPAPHRNSSRFEFQGLPASPNCKRNALDASGKSTGVQCKLATTTPGGGMAPFAMGVPYEFRFGMVAQNASGAEWEQSSTEMP